MSVSSPEIPTPSPAPAEPPVEKPPRQPRWRRVLRWLLRALAVVIIGVAVLLCWVLFTPSGTRFAVRHAMPSVNTLYPGAVEVGDTEGTLAGTLVLKDVVITTPEGEVCVRVGRLEAEVTLLALLGKRVEIRRAVVDDVEYTLFDGTDGVGVARAFVSDEPTPPDEPPTEWVTALHDVSLRNARVFERKGGPLWGDDIHVEVALFIEPDGMRWTDDTVATVVELPTGGFPERRVHFSSLGYYGDRGLDLHTVTIAAGPHRIRGSGFLRAGLHYEVRLDEVAVDMAALAPMLGETALLGTATGAVLVQRAGAGHHVALDLDTPGGHIDLAGDVELAPSGASWELLLRGRGVEPARVLAGFSHPIRADLVLSASGTGDPRTSGWAEAAVTLDGLHGHGVPIDSVSANGRLEDGVATADVNLVGREDERWKVTLRAPEPEEAIATIAGRDVALERWASVIKVPGLSGALTRLDVNAEAALPDGAPMVISATVHGTLAGLFYPAGKQPVVVPNATLDGTVAVELNRQPLPTLDVTLSAQNGTGFGVTARGLRLRALAQPVAGELELTANLVAKHVQAPGDVRADDVDVSLTAVVRPDRPVEQVAAKLTVGGLAVGGLRVTEASAALTLVPRLGEHFQLGVTGGLTGAGISLPAGALDIARARGSLDLVVDRGFPRGQASLRVSDGHFRGTTFNELALTVGDLTAAGATIRLAGRRGAMTLEADASVAYPDGLGGPIDARFAKLRAGDGITGLVVEPDARVRWEPEGRATLRGFRLRRRGGRRSSISLGAELDTSTGSLSGDLGLQRFDLAAWIATAERVLGRRLMSGVPIEGLLTVDARVGGTIARPTAKASITLERARLGGVTDLHATGTASLGRNTLRADLTAGWRGASLRLDAAVPTAWGGVGQLRLRPRAPARLDLELNGLRLEQLAGLVPQLGGMRGQIEGRLRTDGILGQAPISATVSAKSLIVDGLKALNGDVSVRAAAGGLTVGVALRRGGSDWLTVDVRSSTLGLSRLLGRRRAKDVVEALRRASITGVVRLRSTRIDQVLSGRYNFGQTRVGADLRVAGTPFAPAITGTLSAEGYPVGSGLAFAEVTLSQTAGRAAAAVELRLADVLVASVRAVLPSTLIEQARRRLRDLLRDPGLEVAVTLPEVPMGAFEPLVAGLEARVRRLIAGARVGGTVTARGGREGPRLVADLSVVSGAQDDKVGLLRSVELDATLGPSETGVTLTLAQAGTGGTLTATATAPVGTRALLVERKRVDLGRLALTGRLATRGGVRIEPLAAAFPDLLAGTRGALEVDLSFTGTPSKPHVQGSLRAALESLEGRPIGLKQGPVTLVLDFDPGGVALRPFTLRRDGGTLTLSLGARIPSFEPSRIRLKGRLDAKRFPVITRPELEATISAGVDILGTGARPRFQGDVTVDDLVYRLKSTSRKLQPIGLPGDVILVDDFASGHATVDPAGRPGVAKTKPRAAVAAAAFGEKLEMDLEVDIPRRAVRVKSDLIDVWAGGAINVLSGKDGGGLKLLGQVTVVEGKVFLYGKSFTLLEDSRVIFGGADSLDPALDVRAHYPIRDVDLSVLGLDTTESSHIELRVQGTASKPELKLSSEPSMDETNILALITLGFPVGAVSQSRSAAVGGVLLSILTQRATHLLQERLHVDVIKLDTSNLSSARLTVGKRVTRDLLLSYDAHFNADEDENTHEARLQYEITRRLHLDTRYGSAGVGAVDLLFRWRF